MVGVGARTRRFRGSRSTRGGGRSVRKPAGDSDTWQPWASLMCADAGFPTGHAPYHPPELGGAPAGFSASCAADSPWGAADLEPARLWSIRAPRTPSTASDGPLDAEVRPSYGLFETEADGDEPLELSGAAQAALMEYFHEHEVARLPVQTLARRYPAAPKGVDVPNDQPMRVNLDMPVYIGALGRSSSPASSTTSASSSWASSGHEPTFRELA